MPREHARETARHRPRGAKCRAGPAAGEHAAHAAGQRAIPAQRWQIPV
ncbi:MAG TPA: hypothetical protein VMV92_39505 [Streptosporangiaceae bacterium]|nr:hypothetical protein [Streptosporangiaceae bacterium]